MKKTRLLASCLSLVMAFSMAPVTAFAAYAENESVAATETWENCTACSAENPHVISTKAELNKVREHKNTANNVIDGYFKLGNDVAFEASDFAEGGEYYNGGEGWNAIGHNNAGGAYGSNNGISFNGSFDGNDKTISGITTTRPSNWKKYNGLFAFVAGNAKIFDLNLEDFSITGDMSGTLTGMINSADAVIDNVTLTNCTLTTVGLTNMASGILIGKMQGGTVQNIEITDCSYVGNSWGSGYIAGLIQNSTLKNVVVDNCDMSSWTKNGLFAAAIQGDWVKIEDIEIKNSRFEQNHSDTFSLIAPSSGVSNKDESWLKNVSIDVDVNSQVNMAEYKSLFSGNNNAVPMENVKLKVDFNVASQTGSMEMQVENNTIYVINQMNKNKIAEDANTITAYTNGGTFADGTVFEDGTLATPVKVKYKFVNWYEDSEFTTEFAGVPEAGKAYYAKWEELPTAMIGENGYDSLQAAIDAAADGETIELDFDVEETGITVAAGKNVVIDLGGNTVVGDFMVYGTATIKNGTIINTKVVSGIESNGASADLTVENLTVTSNRHALRIDGGKAHIISGTYTSTAVDISCYAVNAGGDSATELIIDGGEFTASAEASTQGTSLMLKNSDVTTTINGGTFNSADIYSFENYGTMTITGGDFKAGFVANDSTVISGGTFGKNPSKYLVSGLESVSVNGTYVIQDKRAFVVTADKDSVAVGETVTVTVTLTGTNLVGAEWDFVYDSNVFEFAGDVHGYKIAGDNVTFAASEVLATYTLRAKVQAPVDANAFTVTNTDAWNIDEANGSNDTSIPGDVVDADVEIVNPDYVVEASKEYIANKKLVLVYTNSDDISFAYDNATMYEIVGKYEKDGYAHAFAIVVDAKDYDAANISIVYGVVEAKYVLTYDANDYDLNDSGEFNLRDVTVVYGVYNGNESTFANYMNIVLNADINKDGIVDAFDANEFVQAYKSLAK